MKLKKSLATIAIGVATLASGVLVFQTSASQKPTMTPIARYTSGIFHEGASEIVTWHNNSQSILVVNAAAGSVDIIDATTLSSDELKTPLQASNLKKRGSVNIQSSIASIPLGAANSVAVHGDLMAVAVENKNKQARGIVAFYTLNKKGQARFSNYVVTDALPDMVTFTPNGKFVLVANEGEPSKDYQIDPEGSVSIISVENGVRGGRVQRLGFAEFNEGGRRHEELSDAVRIFGRNATVAQDLEPEYIAVSKDSRKAFVSLQENNATAVIDINKGTIESINPLGFKHYGENPIDASNKDDGVNIQPWQQVYGMYQPDTIASYSAYGKTFIVTANEGDARDYWYQSDNKETCLASGGLDFDEEDGCLGFTEEVRVKKIKVASDHPHAADAKDKKKLARLKVTNTLGDLDQNGDFEQLYSYGARSFSIWNETGELMYDSGSEFEQITSALLGDDFNNNDDKTKGDSRSDDKGPEPEALAVGEVNGRTYAFIGLERTGGIFMYDITNPEKAEYVEYLNNRDFSVDASKDTGRAGDLSPEGMKFVTASNSPTGNALLIVGYEVSGTTTVYEVR